ncbi:hypothetical protein [Actinophytocola xanthii]|uniref:Glycosyltransferase RgtA/B/C/D-like domain-containing protein n=1 Tax=Actinophytocola xanthii TaxID=1912961 RepID=A0A1Q8CTU2_9PSEU|nr:hypothetical protein [Actinophytocola xanthii]OLF17781.1 hypothetical protein BU204_09835 [Actinophytocola xanthii]
MRRARRLALVGVASGMALLVLAPVLGRGFVLVYDMVFAPRQWLLPDSVGLGSALPRSVPADAVVALVTSVLPGDLVQKLVLLAALAAGPVGAGLLVPTRSVGVRVVAAVAYGWSGYVAERLFIGHWPYLLAYACLPWVARAALALRGDGKQVPVEPAPDNDEQAAGEQAADEQAAGEQAAGEPQRVAVGVRACGRRVALLVLASAPAVLTPSGGLLAAAVGVVCGGRRGLLVTVPVAVVLNAPWWVPAVTHPGGGLSAVEGADAFAARGEGWGGVLVSLLGLGGIWNAEATPASRANPLVPVLVLAIVAVAALGWREWSRRCPGARGLVLLGVAGIALGALGASGLLGWVVANVPGGGLLRDSQKWVAWWALPLAVGFALGAGAAAGTVRRHGGLVLAGAAVLPVAMMPDLAWGGWGRLESVQYPRDWYDVRSVLLEDRRAGDVLALPLSAFRRFGWNEGRTQLDPAPRVLPRTTVIDDTLFVSGRPVAGEDERAARVRAVVERNGDLAALGIGWVLVEHGTPGPPTERVTARLERVYQGRWLDLYRVPGPVATHAYPTAPRAAVLTADLVALATVALGLLWVVLPAGSLSASGTRRRE